MIQIQHTSLKPELEGSHVVIEKKVPLIFSDYEHTFGLTTRNTRTWIKILRTLHECVKRRQINAKSTVPSNNNNNNVELGPQSLHFCTTLPHVRLIISRHVAPGGPFTVLPTTRTTVSVQYYCFVFIFLRLIISESLSFL